MQSEKTYYDHAAEIELIVTAYRKPEVYPHLIELEPSDFDNRVARESFSVIQEIRRSAEEVDFRVLVAELKNRGIDNPEWFLTDAGRMPSLMNVNPHIRRIKELSNIRRIQGICQGINEGIHQRLGSSEVARLAVTELRGISEPFQGRPIQMKEEQVTVEDLQNVRKIKTGFSDLDSILGGFYSGQFIVLGSRPRVGKSAIALQIARNAAQTCPVIIFSLEMLKTSLYLRMISSDTGIPVTRIRDGKITGTEREQITARFSSMKDETPYLSIMDNVFNLSRIESHIARIVDRYEFCLVLVDYLQLVNPSGTKRNNQRYVDVGEVSRTFKRIANEFKIPVLALAQLSRNAEGKVPMLGDLRESGDIEQDADVVMFLHREYNEMKTRLDLNTLWLIAKNRDGDTGIVNLRFNNDRVMFFQVETVREERRPLFGYE